MVANFSDYRQRREVETSDAFIVKNSNTLDNEEKKQIANSYKGIIDSIESDPNRTTRDIDIISSVTGEHVLDIQARLHVQDDIYEAAKSRQPEIKFAEISRRWGIPIDTIKALAFDLVKDRLGIDAEEVEYQHIVKEVKALESLVDAGFRELKLERLARKHKLNRPAMMSIYHKSLINQAPFNAYTVDELDSLTTTNREWLVNGWIPQGVVLLLHAFGGVGKSLLAYELVECIAKGLPWNGYPVPQGQVLILQSDEPVVVTRDRMGIRGLTSKDPVRIVPGWQVEQMARLESYLQEAQDKGQPIKLCMVDSVTAINRNTLISENDTEYARFMLQMSDLGNRYNCTFIVVHHSNSNGESRGTKALYNSASEVWGLLIEDEQRGDRVLRVQKTRMGRPPGRYKFEFDEETFSFTYLGKEGEEMAQEEVMHTEKRVELWLMEDEHRGIPYAVEELANYIGINRHTIRKVLQEMWAKGLLLRKKSSRAYLYYVGELIATDRTDREVIDLDHLGDHFANPETTGNTAPTDQLIAKNTPEKLLRMSKTRDQLITSSEESTVNPELQAVEYPQRSDRPTDRPTDREVIDPLIIENEVIADHFVQIGNVVSIKTNAIWYRNGSDKPPTRQLKPSIKALSQFPITEFPMDLFWEIAEGGKVIELSKDGQRAKVRHQKTGRTSVVDTLSLHKLH
jgi:hypothetical protein